MQQLISHWGGAQRGQPVADLHRECLDTVGKGSQLHYRLLPAHILLVADLDATYLQQALRRFNGVGRSTSLEFRVTPLGRFDAALIPVGRVGEQPDRWLLALEQGMATGDQVALYGHAVGHLLLNYQEEQMGRQPPLDPRNRYAHADTLGELRLLEGFLHVPASARGVYPAPAPGEGDTVIVPARWFEDGSRLWLWLDRQRHRLYGPALAEKLTRLEAGDGLRIEWEPDVIVLRIVDHDPEVHREEARLVDVEELAALRGGLGESYRRSLQAILQEAPGGLIFAEVVKALRERQQHEIHRGTIRALLYSGGFVQKNCHWFAAPDSAGGARQLRAALVETLVARDENAQTQPLSPGEQARLRVQAIHARLSSIIELLRENRDFHT